ncbi:MAG: hypothetical protein ACRD9Q_04025 [Nitrososphaeraceae archaeon]
MTITTQYTEEEHKVIDDAVTLYAEDILSADEWIFVADEIHQAARERAKRRIE